MKLGIKTTKVPELSGSENSIIVSLVLSQYQCVTDRQTDTPPMPPSRAVAQLSATKIKFAQSLVSQNKYNISAAKFDFGLLPQFPPSFYFWRSREAFIPRGVTLSKKAPRSGRVISSDRAKFGVAPRGARAEIQNSASEEFCRRPIDHTCQVSSTSAQRSRILGVLKMLTPHGRTDG